MVKTSKTSNKLNSALK